MAMVPRRAPTAAPEGQTVGRSARSTSHDPRAVNVMRPATQMVSWYFLGSRPSTLLTPSPCRPSSERVARTLPLATDAKRRRAGDSTARNSRSVESRVQAHLLHADRAVPVQVELAVRPVRRPPGRCEELA